MASVQFTAQMSENRIVIWTYFTYILRFLFFILWQIKIEKHNYATPIIIIQISDFLKTDFNDFGKCFPKCSLYNSKLYITSGS